MSIIIHRSARPAFTGSGEVIDGCVCGALWDPTTDQCRDWDESDMWLNSELQDEWDDALWSSLMDDDAPMPEWDEWELSDRMPPF